MYRPSFLANSSLTRVYFALLIPALRLRLRAVSICLPSNRNGSAPKKKVIIISKGQSFVIHRYDSHSTCFVACWLLSSASCSLSFITRMTTCREPKSFNLAQVYTKRRCKFLSKSMSYTFKMISIHHYKMKVLFLYSAVKKG